jgi:hypothetical protein
MLCKGAVIPKDYDAAIGDRAVSPASHILSWRDLEYTRLIYFAVSWHNHMIRPPLLVNHDPDHVAVLRAEVTADGDRHLA